MQLASFIQQCIENQYVKNKAIVKILQSIQQKSFFYNVRLQLFHFYSAFVLGS